GIVVQGAGSISGVLALARVGLWLFPPWWTPYLAAAVILFAIVSHTQHAATRLPRHLIGWAGMVLFTALGVSAGPLLVRLHRASRPPAAPVAVTLASPLAAGRYLVANGGGDLLINAHRASMDTSITRLRDWRGNGHAVDL